jgi:putative transposase
VAREVGVSKHTIYAWKAKYGGMDVSDAKRLKALEEENAKLKRLLADAMLDNAGLKDLLGKSGDARGSPAGGGAPESRPRHERAAGLPRDRRRPDKHALPPGSVR